MFYIYKYVTNNNEIKLVVIFVISIMKKIK